MSKKYLSYNNFIDFGLYLGRRVFKRTSWMHNFVSFSRNFWEVLNIIEIHKRLRKIKPFMKSFIKNGGSILVVGNWYQIHDEVFNQVFDKSPYDRFINIYSGPWPKGAFHKTGYLRFLDIRKLPSLIIIYDFKDSEDVLEEAHRLRVPILGLVDNRVHQNTITNRITIPLGLGTSTKSIYFIFLLLRSYISEGISLLNYEVLMGSFIENSFNTIRDLKESTKFNTKRSFSTFRRFFFNEGFLYKLLNEKRFSKEVWEEMIPAHKQVYIDYNCVFKSLRFVMKDPHNYRAEFENNDLSKYPITDSRSILIDSELDFLRGTIKRYRGVLKHLFVAQSERYIKKHFYFTRDLKKNMKLEVKRVKLIKKKIKKNDRKVK